jgi:hypothetical protein
MQPAETGEPGRLVGYDRIDEQMDDCGVRDEAAGRSGLALRAGDNQ